jgi:hypothetical protein
VNRRAFVTAGTALFTVSGCGLRSDLDQAKYQKRIKEAASEDERMRIIQEMFDDQNRKAAERAAKDFPFELLTVQGTEALASLDRLRDERQGSAVILGGDEGLVRISDGLVMPFLPWAPNQSRQAVLRRAQALAHPRDLELEMDRVWQGRRPSAPVGEWPMEVETAGFQPLGMFANIQSGALPERMFVCRIPTSDWTEIPAFLKFGGWNACPAPEYHVAALRSWRDRYGAELIALAGDILVLHVSRKPKSREEALALASEMYVYNNDLIDQGYRSLAPLAASMMAFDYWAFWWD